MADIRVSRDIDRFLRSNTNAVARSNLAIGDRIFAKDEWGIQPGRDNTVALKEMQRWIWSIDYIPMIVFPSGLIQYSYNYWPSGLGRGAVFVGNGTKLQCTYNGPWSASKSPIVASGYGGDRSGQVEGRKPVDPNYTFDNRYIETAEIGQKFVVLKTPTIASYVWEGQTILIAGLDVQLGKGSPKNMYWFEYHRVLGLDSDNKTIYLDGSLRHRYDASWPNLNGERTGKPFVNLFPSASIHGNGLEFIRFEGFEFLGNKNEPTNYSNPYFAALSNQIIRCTGRDCYALNGINHRFYESRFGVVELDKLIHRAEFINCDFGLRGDSTNHVFGLTAGTGLEWLHVDGCVFQHPLVNCQARNVVIENSNLAMGPSSPAFRANEDGPAIDRLEIKNCRIHCPKISNKSRHAIEIAGFGSKYFTTADGGNGAGVFTISNDKYKGQFWIGDVVWHASAGGIGGRVESIDYDDANRRYRCEVDTNAKFLDSQVLAFHNVKEFRQYGNRLVGNDTLSHTLTNSLNRTSRRKGERFKLTYTLDNLKRTNATSSSNYAVCGVVSKVTIQVIEPGTNSNMHMRLWVGTLKSDLIRVFGDTRKDVVVTSTELEGLTDLDRIPPNWAKAYMDKFWSTFGVYFHDNKPSGIGWLNSQLREYPNMAVVVEGVSV